MKKQHPRPAGLVDRPMFWTPSRAFLKWAIAVILGGCAAFMLVLLLVAPEQLRSARGGGPVVLSLVAAAALVLLSRGRIEASAYVLGAGLWAYVTGISLFLGGLNSMAIIGYPLVIIMFGWLSGPRAAFALTVLTVAATFGFLQGELLGVLPPRPFTAPALMWIFQISVFILSAVLITYVVRSYRDRLEEVRKLGSDLGLLTAEVQSREAELNRAQAVAHVGSWMYDIAPDLMRLSAETCRMFGLPEGTTGSRDSYLSRVHPEDRGAVDSAWQAALKGGKPFDVEHRILVGKTIRWVRQIAELEFGADGAPLRGVGTTQDVTERKRAEEELRKRNAFVESLLENAPIGFAVHTVDDGQPVFVGRNFEKIYGVAAGSVHDTAEFFEKVYLDPVQREQMRQRIMADMASGDPARMRWENIPIRTQAGEDKVITAINIPVPEQNLMISTVQDVTEGHRAQLALTESIAFRALLLEAMPLPVFYKDTAGRYIGGNSAFARFIGKPMEDIVGKTVFEISPQDLAQIYYDKDLDLLKAPPGLQTYESRVAHADGTVHDVIFHKARMADDAGRPSGILGVITDITELKRIEAARDQLEAQLRESQKMEALGTLAGGVAHDFNNVLAAIMGNAELALQDVGPGHAAQESLQEIRKASRRAKDLVQQILAFGRRQVLAREVVRLEPVVEESARLLRTTLPAGVSLSVECAPDAPAVLADPTQVQQVLLNLCANAWQAMQGQERPAAIEVSLTSHQADGTPYTGSERRSRGGRVALRPGGYACLAVRDTGPGMDAATVERIFEPFFTTKPAGQGTGLGLAVVHGIVHEHGGSIDVDSAPGEGTTFRVYFPAVDSPMPAAAAQPADGAPAPGQGRHILYVDDDEAIVFLMVRLLQRQGYRVSGYTDAREALAAVRAQPEGFDLAVTDYNMPGMSGLEVARALREIRADLPVALASGYITEELRAQAPAAGVRELVYKPNTADELCAVISRLAKAQDGKEYAA